MFGAHALFGRGRATGAVLSCRIVLAIGIGDSSWRSNGAQRPSRDRSMLREFAAGNYTFLPSVFQYSGGAAAHAGFESERVRFRSPVPLAAGSARIARPITEAGRPLTAF